MKLYLDMCCLKRPFDDQTQTRIALETSAVLALLRLVETGVHAALRSPSHDFENASNPDPRRAEAVSDWLSRCPAPTPSPGIESTFRSLRTLGVGQMDAYHLAWASALAADVFLTTDDRLLAKRDVLATQQGLRVTDPVSFAREVDS